MKKSIIALVTLLTFLLFSCASDSVENADDLIDEIEAPELMQETENEPEISLFHNLPEPEDFEEPVVRDLEITELPEETVIAATTIEEKNNVPATNTEATISTVKTENIISETNPAANINTQTNESSVKTIPVESKNTEKASSTVNNTANKTDSLKTNTSTTAKTETKAENTTVSIPDTKTTTQNNTVAKADTATQQKKETTSNSTNENNKKIEQEDEQIENNPAQYVETEQKEFIPSRKVTVNTNETLTITYPGYGWIYLGSETSENNNLVSTGRRVENDETVYTLTAKNPGTQIQHFYKVDTITGDFIDDYIEVSVLDNKGSVYTVVKAPDYAEIVPERPETPAVASTKKTLTITEIEQKEVKPTEKRSYEVYVPEKEVEHKTTEEKSIYQKTPDVYAENLDADDLLEKAKALFDAKQFVESQKYLNTFMSIATERRDEGLFLQGQILEQDGATKNIKESISSYTTLTESYPESIYWDDANKRIIYLNRFYIQIR